MTSFIADASHLENSTEFLWGLTDTEFRFVHTNRLFQKQFGLEDDRWKGRLLHDVVQSFQIEKFLHANNECINNPGKTISIEIQTTTATNENWFRWEVSAIVNNQNNVTGIRLLGTDITKQKKAEQILLQQALLLDNIPVAIISTDENFCIKSWNLKAEMMFQLRHEKENNNVLHEIRQINFINDSEINFKSSITNAGFWNGEMVIENNNRSKFHLITMVNAIKDKAGKTTGFAAAGRDITKENEIKNTFAAGPNNPRPELIKEQKQFNTFMEYAPALAWMNDEDGILQYMNTSFKDTFHLSENNIGKKIYDYYPESIKPDCIASDKEALAKNTCIQNFEENLNGNDEKISYQVYKFPVGEHNNKRLVGGLAFNITGQINDRMEIIKERSQFQSFMENAPLLAWITDAEGVLLYMNTRFKSSYCYTDEYLNKKIGSIKPITDREKALLPHNDVIIKNKSIELFQEWTDENKKARTYKTFKFPIEDVEGNYLEGGQSIEITAELLAQSALKKSNELFEYAGKATRDVIWDWDLKENKIRRTGGYKNLYGYEMTDLYEPHTYEKIHKEDITRVLRIVEEAFKRNDSRWHIEYRYLCSDGSYKIVIDQAYIIRNKNGKAVRVIGSMQDVTEERNLQQQVLITEKQKKKDVVDAVIAAQEKERNELSAELHDNVNQLLAASILYLKTAQKQEVIKENLITQSLDYVQKAVDELRGISRNLTPSELKMNGLGAALKVFAEKLHIPKSFEVKLVIGELNENKISQPLKLAVYRIVQEVINNILKHANATNVAIHVCETGNNLKLTVTDNGKGVDLSAIKKGLGIINIYNRTENFGGSAEIISSPGKGCTWNVVIPLI
ncbi:PAS domain S-box protein [Ginsengibacter hankyongi]|uniref:histidine kinase n=1 Tax=Ginsengibacter hankyongi TaxID=2607284 RepID=A0A5J5IM02_9BACT|nr:PAS domain S-box protein [Ginsengibacter hankyongi]KAA9040874.1 PAS domain S-box protein [Ginsengibacter hankyongi]